MDGRYDLTVAANATEGFQYLTKEVFDIIIVDIRIPPGESQEFKNIYYNSEQGKINSRLGMELLRFLLSPDKSAMNFSRSTLSWVNSQKIGVFTKEGENELKEDLENLNIQVYQQKTAGISNITLLNIAEEILNQQDKSI